MYNSYFGFSESPFENNLDQRFLFVSDDHKEVLAALAYFIKTKKGFAIVCGDVGTGKTMLINSFIRTLPEYVQPIIVSNPCVSPLELLRYIAKALKIEVRDKEGILELTDTVKDLLIKAHGFQKQFVLIIDEAHLLPDQALEDIRLLSNIETQDQKLLQILLVGQYELSYKLDRPEMRHLRQRININRFLSPLNAFETSQYIDHRLRQVGSSFASVFRENCKGPIFKMTKGVPRNINQLCDNALLICLGEMREKVDRQVLRKAQEALLTDRIFTPKFVKPTNAFYRGKFFKPLVLATACALFFILGTILNQAGFLGKGAPQLSHDLPPSSGEASGSRTASASKPNRDSGEIAVAPDKKAASANAAPSGEPSQSFYPAPATRLVENRASPLGGPEKPEATGGSPGSAPGPRAPLGQPGPPARVEAKGPEALNKEPAAARGDTLKPASSQRVTKPGENLSAIASQNYGGVANLGLEAIIFDNPEIKNKALIHPGQIIHLPTINSADKTMQLRDNLFYAPQGRYESADALKEEISRLEQLGVRYKIVDINGPKGTVSHRVLLGGYEKAADLQKARGLIKAK